jgi:hypothetical protein
MEKVVQIFSSHSDADAADRAYYARLSPEERLEIQLELIRRQRELMGEASERLERVLVVAQLSRS